MKKLLLLLFVTLIPFSSYATYLICDGGSQQFIGEADYTEGPGDSFEIELLNNNRADMSGYVFCVPRIIHYITTDTHVYLGCSNTNGGVQEGSISISRLSGVYDFELKITYEGTVIGWFLQKGKCTVAEKTLF